MDVSHGFRFSVARSKASHRIALTQRLYDAIVGIQYGQAPDPDNWTVEVP
jgi:hypothetical protein